MQRVQETDLLRDAVLVLQGINGHNMRFHDAASEIERDKRGLPVHPLEQGGPAAHVEGQLLFLKPDSQVRLKLADPNKHPARRLAQHCHCLDLHTCLDSANPDSARRGRVAISTYNALHRDQIERPDVRRY